MGNPEKKYEMSSRDNISVLMEVSHWSNIPAIQEIKRWCSELLLIKQFRRRRENNSKLICLYNFTCKTIFANVQLKYVFFKLSGMWDFSLVVYVIYKTEKKWSENIINLTLTKIYKIISLKQTSGL